MTRSPHVIAVPEDLGRRILDAARIAAAMHLEISQAAGGTGEDLSTDGAATDRPHAGFWRRMLDRIR
jgi:hypothetical protein